MPSCFICKVSPTSTAGKEQNLILSSFPRLGSSRRPTFFKWLKFCKLDPAVLDDEKNIRLLQSSYLCSRHFKPEDYTNFGRRSVLKPQIVPSLYPPIGPDVCRHDTRGCCKSYDPPIGPDDCRHDTIGCCKLCGIPIAMKGEVKAEIVEEIIILESPSHCPSLFLESTPPHTPPSPPSPSVCPFANIIPAAVQISPVPPEKRRNVIPVTSLGVRNMKNLSPEVKALMAAYRNLQRRYHYLKMKMKYASKDKKRRVSNYELLRTLKDRLPLDTYNLVRPHLVDPHKFKTKK
ncbi:uncharacterized protein [Periplaneta americana]|uniref:uncharacterized protein n=1 Tax=Periplaneta americana TaxID=6978 RepID=UPI0037E823D6